MQGKEKAEGEHAADHRLLDVRSVLAVEHASPQCRRHRACFGLEYFGETSRSPHGPDLLDADHRIGELRGLMAHLCPVAFGSVAPVLHHLPEREEHEEADEQYHGEEVP